MLTEDDLANILVQHEGANPEDAHLAAGLILDELDRTGRSLRDLVAASKAGFPTMYKRTERASTPVPPALTPSLTERVAMAAKTGAALPSDAVTEALAKMRPRAF